ncbi:MAG: TetR family transcriptional regulator C-terminal domain-containing protein [Nocardioides sp.]|nr:TetR family transcriptional regulator C-terminal domain-containing protein [Nocardioides sp.]
MPRLLDTDSRTDTVVCAINEILARDGAAGLTMRAIGRESRISPGSLTMHYTSREHLLRVAAHRTGRARRDEIRSRCYTERGLAFLPRDSEEIVQARVWLSWCDQGRSAESLSETIREARAEELGLLAQVFDYHLARPELDALYALLDGLTTAVCAALDPMPLATARAIATVGQERAASAAARSSETIRSGSSAE